ncbi:hypothetical protein M231_01764 [Tremella mesenterica]|uniref:RRM domain-containing protein n=1 Tax=Tremella mesenterica TaxID=5217 RepID=A0A4Q1BSI1_TREME|nr:hypothetical protein M231_01764 [Tremella mesenterica]
MGRGPRRGNRPRGPPYPKPDNSYQIQSGTSSNNSIRNPQNTYPQSDTGSYGVGIQRHDPPGIQTSGSGAYGPPGSQRNDFGSQVLDQGYPARPRENFQIGSGRGRNRSGGGGGRARSPDGRRSRPLGSRDHDRPIPHIPDRGTIKMDKVTMERVAQERPCRILFVRNITYETSLGEIMKSFETFGAVKKVFDMIPRRGMMFVTYYDLRAAERARDAMHGTILGPRAIDVHYSLPKPEDLQGQCERDSNQGSVMCILHHQRILNESDIGRCAANFGAVKLVLSTRSPNEKVVEFFDSREAVRFHDEMDGKPLAGGTLEVKFVWDDMGSPVASLSGDNQPPMAPPPPIRPYTESHPPAIPNGQYEIRREDQAGLRMGDNRYVPPPPAVPAAGHYPPSVQSVERRGDPRFDDPRAPGGASRYDRAPPGPSPGRYDGNAGRYEAPVTSQGPYNPPAGRYDAVPPAPPAPDERLEQARKVQQLLANLSGAPATPYNPPQSYPPANTYPQENKYQPPQPTYPPAPLASSGQDYQQPASEPPRTNYPPPQSSYPPPPSGYPPNSYPPPPTGYNNPPGQTQQASSYATPQAPGQPPRPYPPNPSAQSGYPANPPAPAPAPVHPQYPAHTQQSQSQQYPSYPPASNQSQIPPNVLAMMNNPGGQYQPSAPAQNPTYPPSTGYGQGGQVNNLLQQLVCPISIGGTFC